ncbi:DUF1488 family protein [Labrys neptuniae]
MPLHDFVGEPFVRLHGVGFRMQGDAEIVHCFVTAEALEDFLGRTEVEAAYATIFEQLRGRIASLASALFDKGDLEDDVVVVNSWDLNPQLFPNLHLRDGGR